MINGYNHLYKAVTGPISRPRPIGGFVFEQQYEVQGRSPKLSNSAVRNLVQISPRASGGATLEYNASLTFTAALTPENLYSQSKIHGDPYWSIYQGTSAVGSMQIYPNQGAGITDREYEVRSGFDLGTNNDTDWDGINAVNVVNIEKLSAGSVSVFASVQWNYIIDNAGTVA